MVQFSVHQDSSSGAETGLKGGWVPQLSAQVTLVPSGAGVVCHINTEKETSTHICIWTRKIPKYKQGKTQTEKEIIQR